MKANPGKCHPLLSTKSPEVVSIDGIQITSSTAETLIKYYYWIRAKLWKSSICHM